MNLSDFYYDLPAERIAQEPVEPRDRSRLLVVDCVSGSLAHRRFQDIQNYLVPGDTLVLNSTKVFPARLRGRKKTGGKVEILLLNQKKDSSFPAATGGESMDPPPVAAGNDERVDEVWRALVRGATSPTEMVFPEDLTGVMKERLSEGEWEIRFSGGDVRAVLERHGEMPLPPYIKRPEPRAADLARYQTVFAQQEGAVAAPTAGFHFTRALLDRLRAQGVQILEIVLHVGWGTFRPVRTETIEEHRMLAERYVVNEQTAAALNTARQKDGRIVAVGTTAVRTLESIVDASGRFQAGTGETSLFIYPGYAFKAVDALITNFHLSDSTPLLLANAFYSHKTTATASPHPAPSPQGEGTLGMSPLLGERPTKGRVRGSPFSLKPAYEAAIREGYRFYSYGDAMFIQ